MKKKTFDLLPHIVIILMIMGLLLISCSTGILVGFSEDVPVYLGAARNILNGKILYTGIVDNKGPILYFIDALFLKLGGQFGIILLEFILLYLIFYYTYKTVKLLNDNKKQQIIILVLIGTYMLRFFTHGLSCEEYALAFSMIGFYECIKYYKNDKFSIYQCFLLGLLGGLCFFIRQNLIIVFAGFGIGIFIKHIIEKRYKELIKYIIFSILGFLTVALPILGYLLINNSFDEYIYCTFTMNLTFKKYGFFPSLWGMFVRMPITVSLLLFYLYMLTRNMIKNKKIQNLSIILTIIITIILNSISALITYHYFITFIPIIIIMFNQLFKIDFDSKPSKGYNILLFVLIIGIIIVNIYPLEGKYYHPQPHQDIIDYIKANTNKEDKIAVIAFDDEIYYLSEREPVSKYTYILTDNIFSEEVQTKIIKEYFDDIYTLKPEIIVEDFSIIAYAAVPTIDYEEYQQFLSDNYDLMIGAKEIEIYEGNQLNNNITDFFFNRRVFQLKESSKNIDK